MIKLINIITQNIILLGCCAISIFILNEFIPVVKNIIADFNLTNNIKS